MNLKELSHHLGLSQTTVSRALNGFPEVSAKTRARVQKAADSMGYAPSQAARGLATGKVGAIGHVIPLGEHKMINPHFSDFMAGVGSAYANSGTDIVMKICHPEDELRIYGELARSKRVDGFVVQAPMIRDDRVELLLDLGIPFVVHGRSIETTRAYNFLDVDNIGAFRRATEFLLGLGHRNIALLNGLETMSFAHHRRTGFEKAMQAADVPLRDDLMFSQDMSEAYGFDVTSACLSRPNPPTALLTSSRLVALGAIRAISEQGFTLGQDISVATFDDDFGFLGTRAAVPLITCLRSSLYDAGEAIAKMAIAATDAATETQNIIWEPELVVGRSTGVCPAA